jgi:hypothetical protein
MYPHRIRLRGPWTLQPTARATAQARGCVEFSPLDLPPPQTVRHPCCWRDAGFGDFAGRVKHTREFGAPRRLDPHERVWLTCDRVKDEAAFLLNGSEVGTWFGQNPPFEFEITRLLQEHNRLEIVVTSTTADGGIPGDVALEIRCTAWLRKLEVGRVRDEETDYLTIRGEAVGEAKEPLDLYAIVGRSTCIQATVEAEPSGRPFAFTSEPLRCERSEIELPVRIELVNGSQVWYEWQGSVVFPPREETP